MNAPSEIQLVDGGRIVGVIIDFDESGYHLVDVARIHRGRRLFKFRPSGITVVPYEAVAAVKTDEHAARL